MQNIKKKRKCFDAIYISITIAFWMFFVVAACLYAQHYWLLIAAAVALIAWILYTLVFAFLHWSWFISDMINAYKKKQDLLSGGCALMVLFLALIVMTCYPAFAGMPEGYVTFANTLSSFFVAAMSAMIGLIGVQYTIAIQERNRKEDLRRASKPYFVVDAYVVDTIPDENGHTFRRMQIGLHIRNISSNIGIPYVVKSLDASECEIGLNYMPLQHESVIKECIEIWSDEPYKGPANIELCYKDAFENNYKMHVSFELHKNPESSNTRVLSDEFVGV